ncbi:MAG: helix-turn-helix transcriptional regulator [Clostridia bacterium]|nr:helix-turn-helix transcriptional regulator [Clostridia bacterium]
MKYAKRIRDLREDRDLTQKDVAAVLKTTYQYYSTYESGKRELPFSRAIILAEFYNVSLNYLAGLTDIPEKLHK